MNENLLGKVCAASNGSLGVPFTLRRNGRITYWEGVSLKGSIWRSRNPKIIAKCVEEYLHVFRREGMDETHLIYPEIVLMEEYNGSQTNQTG